MTDVWKVRELYGEAPSVYEIDGRNWESATDALWECLVQRRTAGLSDTLLCISSEWRESTESNDLPCRFTVAFGNA